VLVSSWEQSERALNWRTGFRPLPEDGRRQTEQRLILELALSETMEPASDRMPDDVLVVEDDPIIALDFEDTILGFGTRTVRTASSVALALRMIDERAPTLPCSMSA